MKKMFILLPCLLVALLATTIIASAPIDDAAPGAVPASGDAFGDMVFSYNVEGSSGCNRLLGVEFVYPYFYVTGGCSPNSVYIFDEDGAYVDEFTQGTSSDWGWRDMAWDGTYLYASDSGDVDYFETDGTYVGSFSGPENPNRAMAYDPATDHFWTANFASSIYEFSRAGTVINTCSNTKSIYGMAWDDVSDGGPFLWIFEQDDNKIWQFDPGTCTYTGVSISNVPAGTLAGGLAFTTEWGASDDSAILVGLSQTEPDTIFGVEVIEELWPTLKPKFTNTPPTIDGALGGAEWNDAWHLEFEGATMDFDLYLMGDVDNLYGAIDALDDSVLNDGDMIRLYFDNNNDDAWPATCVPGTNKEGYYGISYTAADGVTLVYKTVWDDAGTPTTCETLTPTALTAAANLSGGNMVFEFAIDMDGGEMYGDLGEITGLYIHVIDNASDYAIQVWPEDATSDPASFGDLKYHDCNGCLIDDYCWDSGDVNPVNDCASCNPGVSGTAWSNREGFVCDDDGVFCNGDEICVAMACDGHSGDPCEDDGKFCNGDEYCEESTDECLSEGTPCPDDGLFCTGDEFCMELFDQCNATGDPCPDGTTCDEDLDECVAGDDDVVDDDIVDDDVVDDDVVDDDVVDDDVVDDDIADDDIADDDIADDDMGDDDDDDDDDGCGC